LTPRLLDVRLYRAFDIAPDGRVLWYGTPQYMNVLADIQPGLFCYLTNRRNGVAFDPVIRRLADGSERRLVLGDVRFAEASVSPDGRWLALTADSKITAASANVVLADLADGRVSWLVTSEDADLTGWLSPDGKMLLVERNVDGASVLALHDAATGALVQDIPLPASATMNDHMPAPR
jgi:Tol biopolymer transport system component